MTAATGKTRKNLTLAPETRDLIEHYATEWDIDQGAVVDRFVAQGAGIDKAEQLAADGLGPMEELLRRVFGDFAARVDQDALRRDKLRAVETSMTRLLLFALLAHMKGERVAVANEDEAKRVAEQGYADGDIPLLLRGKVRHE